MPYQPKHRIAVAWKQTRKSWQHQAIQPHEGQTHHDRHDLPTIVVRFGRSESPHPSALQIAENYHTDPTKSQPQLN